MSFWTCPLAHYFASAQGFVRKAARRVTLIVSHRSVFYKRQPVPTIEVTIFSLVRREAVLWRRVFVTVTHTISYNLIPNAYNWGLSINEGYGRSLHI